MKLISFVYSHCVVFVSIRFQLGRLRINFLVSFQQNCSIWTRAAVAVFHHLGTVHISAAVPVAPNNCILVEPSGSYGVSGSQQPQNTNFDQNLPIGAL